jgi:hypothetical protein
LVSALAEAEMIVASWLIAVDPKQERAARAALASGPGHQVKEKQGSRWLVLLTESAQDLATLRRELLATPGVHSADPIASFDDSEPAHELVRWAETAR